MNDRLLTLHLEVFYLCSEYMYTKILASVIIQILQNEYSYGKKFELNIPVSVCLSAQNLENY